MYNGNRGLTHDYIQPTRDFNGNLTIGCRFIFRRWATSSISEVVTLALSGSIPLLIVVLGLVEFYKRLNAAGNLLTILSMITGVVFGGLYLYLVTEPVAALGIFLCIIYGIVIGLIASGVYDLAKQLLTPKTA